MDGKRAGKTRMLLLRVFVWLIVMISIFLMVGSLMSWLTPAHDWLILKVMDGFLTKMTIIFSICAIALFISGKLTSVIGGARKIWLFLKARHVLFGWIAVAAAAGHSVYFLVFLPKQMNVVISGLAAFAIMMPLVVAGFYFDKKARMDKRIRIIHTILGFGFIASLIWHVVIIKS